MGALRETTITTRWLTEQRACRDQINLFRATFGTSAEITPDMIRRAADAGLDLEWAAKHLLGATALAAYERAAAAAWAAYEQDAALSPGWAAYHQAMDAALIEILFPDAPNPEENDP